MTAITALGKQETYYQSMMESAIQPSCTTCNVRPDRIFCDMPLDSLKAFDEIKSVGTYPRSTALNLFVIGEVLGLGAVLSNTPYEITAELLDAS